jgi:hypothetical protein
MGQQPRHSPSRRGVEALELKEGDEIEIHIVDGRELSVARKPT